MKDTPHILIFPGWYPTTLHPFSGDFVQFQADLLQRFGFPLSIMHLDLDYRYGVQKLIPQYENFVDNFGLQTFVNRGFSFPKWSKKSFVKWSKNYLKLFEKYKDQLPDDLIIHAHNYMGGLGAMAVKEKYGIPYIITEHSTTFLNDTIPELHTNFLKVVFNKASLITSVSDSLAEKLSQWTNTEIKTIPNFIDTELFYPSTDKYEIFSFVFAGNLIARKNPNLLIDAFYKLQNKISHPAQLIIIGEGDQEMELKHKAEKLGITNVIFKGQLGLIEVAAEIAKCHALVLSSQYETFGLVLAEALSCGLPIISTPSGGPEDIINEKNGILLNDFSENGLAQAMKNIMADYQKYNPLKLRSDAIAKYSVAAVASILMDIYQKYSCQSK